MLPADLAIPMVVLLDLGRAVARACARMTVVNTDSGLPGPVEFERGKVTIRAHVAALVAGCARSRALAPG